MISTLGLLFSFSMAATAPSQGHLAISRCDAGEHYQFEIVECAIELKNTGDKPVKVTKGEAKFPWDSIDTGTIVVPPKGTAYINAKVDVRNDEGLIRRAFRFMTDETGQDFRGSEVLVMAVSAIDQAKPKIDLGVVTPDKKLPEASIALSSREIPNFRIASVISKPDWLDVDLADDGRTVRARLLENRPWGLIHHDHFIKLKVDGAQQKQVWVAIEANVQSDVVPDSNPFQLGLMRTNASHELLFRLSSRSGKNLKIGKLEVKGIKADASSAPCLPATASCRLIKIKVSNDQPPGKLEGILDVELPDYGRSLPIELVGVLLTPDVKIHEMDELLKQSEEGGQSKVASEGKPDLSKALAKSVKPEAPPPPGNGPLLRWNAAHQTAIYGYIIYRGDSENGPVLRVNKETIRVVADGPDESGSYQWRDDTAQAGSTYWYRIGLLNRNGSKQDLTGPQKVVAK